VFSSTGTSFQVAAGTATANALLGNFKAGANITAGTGAAVSGTYTGAAMTTATGAETVKLQVTLNGVASVFSVAVSNTDTAAAGLLTDVQAATSGGKTLAQNGVTVTENGSNQLVFTGPAGVSTNVAVAGDVNNFLGLGSWQGDFATQSYDTGVGTPVYAAGTGELDISVNGGDKIAIALSNTNSGAAVLADVQKAITNNATLTAAGITAVVGTGGAGIKIATTTNGVDFRVNVASAPAGFDLQLGGAANTIGVASAGSMDALTPTATEVDASGSAKTELGASGDVFSFKALLNAGDQQTLGFSAQDATGALQSTSITLTKANAGSLDAAINAINAQLRTNTTLQNVVAVKEQNSLGTAEGIRFISADPSFSVKVGSATNYTTSNPVGLYDGTGAAESQGQTVNSSSSGTMDITTQTGAQQAVVALGAAVTKLGDAQAAIGQGQNQLNYAIGLAQSQIANFSAAESQIRDTDVAAEAANLTKASVLQQASIAAMAQANSAPQAVLALLRA